MAIFNCLSGINCTSGKSRNGLSQLHSGQHDINDDYGHRNHRNDCHGTSWWRLQKLVGLQRHSQWSYWRRKHNLLDDNCRRGVPDGNCGTSSRNYRNGNDYTHNRTNLYTKLAVNLLPVILFLPVGIKAQEVNATASPIATSSGSVSNQAVQINQGGFSEQSFSPGHRCNSATMVFTPFYLGNESNPAYTRNQNFGAQLSFSIPLDGRMVELCKSLAEKKLEKERLDYALIRALKCAELLDKGFMFHPDSPYSVVCADVVPIALSPKKLSPSPEASDKN